MGGHDGTASTTRSPFRPSQEAPNFYTCKNRLSAQKIHYRAFFAIFDFIRQNSNGSAGAPAGAPGAPAAHDPGARKNSL